MKHVAELAGIPAQCPLCLFGAGQGGRILLSGLADAGRLTQVQAILDNHQTGDVDGIPLLRPSEALERGWADMPVVIASQYWSEIAAQLSALGFRNLINIYPLIDRLRQESLRSPSGLSLEAELQLRLGYTPREFAGAVLSSPHLKPIRGWFAPVAALLRSGGTTDIGIIGTGDAARRFAALAARQPGVRIAAFVAPDRDTAEEPYGTDDVPVLTVKEFLSKADRNWLIVNSLPVPASTMDWLQSHGFTRLVDGVDVKEVAERPYTAPPALPEAPPLVSVMLICRNAVGTVRRAIESILGQDYPNIEFVIQDGGSDDGTLDIIESYCRLPQWRDRIRLVSERDGCVSVGLFRAFRRCQGDIIASCMSDEELLPNAVSQAVAAFRERPEVGAITGNSLTTDQNGNTTGTFIGTEFNLAEYLFGDYCPYFPASFFSRRALEDIGLHDNDWNEDVTEFELWCRLATRHKIAYVDHVFCKYAIHDQQLSNIIKHIRTHFFERTEVLTRLFAMTGFFGLLDNAVELWQECIARQYILFFNHALALQLPVHDLGVAPKVAGPLQPVRPLPPSTAVYDAVADLYGRRGFAEQALAIRQSARRLRP
jgi:Glycosyltransferases, probably involved in cell wall biogenesis